MSSLYKDILDQASEDEDWLHDEWEDIAYGLDSLFDKYNVDLYDILDTPVGIDRRLLSRGMGVTRLVDDKPEVYFSPIITDNQIVPDRDACAAIVHEMLHVAAYFIDHKLSHEGAWKQMSEDPKFNSLNISQFCDGEDLNTEIPLADMSSL